MPQGCGDNDLPQGCSKKCGDNDLPQGCGKKYGGKQNETGKNFGGG